MEDEGVRKSKKGGNRSNVHSLAAPFFQEDIRCPKCLSLYKIEEGKYSTYERVPVLLSCGHASCEVCVGNLSSFSCTVCNQVTQVEKGEQMTKHFYIMGLIAEGKNQIIQMKHYPLRMQLVKRRTNTENDLCQECSQAKAAVMCKRCMSQLCHQCFRKIHRHKTMKLHEAEPLNSYAVHTEPPKCPEHPDSPSTFLCKTCSQENKEMAFCVRCRLLGIHQYHEVIDIADLNSEYLPEIEKLMGDLVGIIDLLHKSKMKCTALMKNVEDGCETVVHGIRTYTHQLHGLLQHIENSAIQDVLSHADNLLHMFTSYEMKFDHEIALRETLLKYARAAVSRDVSFYHPKKMMNELQKLVTEYPLLACRSEMNDSFFRFEVVDGLKEMISKSVNVSAMYDQFQMLSSLKVQSTFYQDAVGSTDDKCQKLLDVDSESQNSEENLNLLTFSPFTCLESPGGSSEALSQVTSEPLEDGLNENCMKNMFHFKVSYGKIHSDDLLNGRNKAKENTFGFSENKSLLSECAPANGRRVNNKSNNVGLHCSEFVSKKNCALQDENESLLYCKDKNEKSSSQNLTDTDDSLYLLASDMGTDVSVQSKQALVQEQYFTVGGIPPRVVLQSQDLSNKSTADVNILNLSPTSTQSKISNLSLVSVTKSTQRLKDWEVFGAHPKMPALHEANICEDVIQDGGILCLKSISSSTVSPQSVTADVTSSFLPNKRAALLIEEEVEVTHIQTPSSFFVQRKVDVDKIKNLFKELNAFAKTDISQEVVPLVGKVYLGQYTRDNRWYRVLVKSVNPNGGDVFIEYVDYGNSEKVELSRLHECPTEYQLGNVPSFALFCGLWEIKPSRGETWDTRAIQTFADFVNGVSLQLLIISYDSITNFIKCEVDLRRPGKTAGITNDFPVSIREVLVFLEYAAFVNKSLRDLDCEVLCKRCFFNPEIPFGEDGTPVLLSHLVSPQNFSLQLVSSSDYLSTLMALMQKHYNSPKVRAVLDWYIFVPKIGMPCVAKHSGDGRWYRAKIKDLPGKQKVDVLYVDFGNEERLWYNQICKITDDFLRLPAQAISCCLYEIITDGDQGLERVSDQISNICEFQDLKAIFHSFKEEFCIVSLIYKKREAVGVGGLLIDHEIGSAFKVLKNIKPKRGHHLELHHMSLEMPLDQEGFSPRRCWYHHDQRENEIMVEDTKPSSSKNIHVEVLGVLSPFCYIQLRPISYTSQYKQLQGELEEEILKMELDEGFKPSAGELCVVKMRQIPCQARARILKLDREHAEVLLIDCGGMEKTCFSCLHPLPEKFKTMKDLCLIVSLADIIPPGGLRCWPGTTIDRLKEELAAQKNFYMVQKGSSHFDSMLETEVQHVELGWIQEVTGGPFEASCVLHISLNELLIENGLALPVRSSAPAMPHEHFKGEEGSTDHYINLNTTDHNLLMSEDSHFVKQEIKGVTSWMLVDETPNASKTHTTNIHSCHWLPCPLPVTTTFTAIPSHVDSQGVVYLQPLSNAKTLELICETQTMQFSGSFPSDSDLCCIPGDPVIARFHLDNKWYRATVVKLEENGEAEVQFVDYGNTETVKLHDLRRNMMYSHLPIQCYRSKLHNINPVNLELIDVGVDVASLLTDKLETCHQVITDDEQNSVDVVIETESSKDTNCCPPRFPPTLLPSDISNMFSVEVTAIRDPSHVYIAPVVSLAIPTTDYQLALTAHSRNYQRLISYVNSNIKEFPVANNIKVGDLYLGKFITGHWYRIQVQKLSSETAIVLFVDFGNLEEIPQDCIRMCPEDGRKIPAYAVGVRLYQVQPVQGPGAELYEASMRGMIACLMGPQKRQFLASVMELGDPIQVQLFNMESSGTYTLAYSELVDKGLIDLKHNKDE
ncbi:RING finger protein 17-like isoform X2 [Panulirus ornatus]|uniref:RING finger protein 17-like isoform X2 n=1 Tax=Panulirus ornatus TaxID=150431 RepID=UPI003A8653F9